MQNSSMKKAVILLLATGTLVAGMSVTTAMEAHVVRDMPLAYIIQGYSLDEVSRAVFSVNARVTRELGIIDAVAAELTIEQRAKLSTNRAVLKIVSDRTAGAGNNAQGNAMKAGD